MKRRLVVGGIVSLIIVVAGVAALFVIRDDSPGTGRLTVDGAAGAVRIEQAADQSLPEDDWVEPISPVFEVGPSGSTGGPVTITIRLDRREPAGGLVFLATRETPDDAWAYIPATLSDDGRSISASVDHFSLFSAVRGLVDRLADTFRTEFQDAFTGSLAQQIDPPTCAGETEAADAYTATVDAESDAVFWCLGTEGGETVLKVTGHRRYPMLISHPGFHVVDAGQWSDQWGDLASLSRGVSGDQSVVTSGDTVVFGLDPLGVGETASISTEFNGPGQSLAALQAGVDALLAITTRGGEASLEGSAETLHQVVSDADCAAAVTATESGPGGLGDVLLSCLRDQTLTALSGAGWSHVFSLFLSGAKTLAFLQGEANALTDLATGHDVTTITITPSGAVPGDDLTDTPAPTGSPVATWTVTNRAGDEVDFTLALGEPAPATEIVDQGLLGECYLDRPDRAMALPVSLTEELVSDMPVDVAAHWFTGPGYVEADGEANNLLLGWPWATVFGSGETSCDTDLSIAWNHAAPDEPADTWQGWLIIPDQITPRTPDGDTQQMRTLFVPTPSISVADDFYGTFDYTGSTSPVRCNVGVDISGIIDVFPADPAGFRCE